MSKIGLVTKLLCKHVQSVVIGHMSLPLNIGKCLAHQRLNEVVPRATIHTSSALRDLTEFFEVEKFRGEKVVRVGREWR